MIVDAILYNGESDLFDLRYNILKDVVDEFVVVEFGTTFSGKPKEAHPINLPKVSYHFFTQVRDLKQDLPPAFAMEYNQREMIKECLGHREPNDTIVIGDCDEIWNPAYPLSNFLKMKLRVYTYHLNNRSNEQFVLGPIVRPYYTLKNESINHLRSTLPLNEEYRGWHFTSMGGAEKLKEKIEAYGHQEFNTPQIKDNLENVLKDNKDYIGRNFTYTIDESEWPQYLKDHRQEYLHLLK